MHEALGLISQYHRSRTWCNPSIRDTEGTLSRSKDDLGRQGSLRVREDFKQSLFPRITLCFGHKGGLQLRDCPWWYSTFSHSDIPRKVSLLSPVLTKSKALQHGQGETPVGWSRQDPPVSRRMSSQVGTGLGVVAIKRKRTERMWKDLRQCKFGGSYQICSDPTKLHHYPYPGTRIPEAL